MHHFIVDSCIMSFRLGFLSFQAENTSFCLQTNQLMDKSKTFLCNKKTPKKFYQVHPELSLYFNPQRIMALSPYHKTYIKLSNFSRYLNSTTMNFQKFPDIIVMDRLPTIKSKSLWVSQSRLSITIFIIHYHGKKTIKNLVQLNIFL